MKTEMSLIMNSVIQFFIFVFKAIFYRKKQTPKKQLEYLYYTGVRRFSIFSFFWGGEGQSLVLTGLLGGGHEGGTMISKLLLPTAPHHRSYAYVLLIVSTDKCHIHMCTIFFTLTSINESISSDHYHFHVDC